MTLDLSQFPPPETDPREPISGVVIQRTDDKGNPNAVNNMIAQTSSIFPNILVKTMTPVKNVVIRGLRTLLQTMLGILSAQMVAPTLIPASDFMHQLKIAASLSVAATVISVIQNTAELLAKWDQDHPTVRG